MPEKSVGGKLIEGILQNLGAALVIAIGAAGWQKVKHGSVDWWAIGALFALACAMFGSLIYFRRKETISALERERAGKAPGTVIVPHWFGYESEEKWKKALVEEGRKENEKSHREELRRLSEELNGKIASLQKELKQTQDESVSIAINGELIGGPAFHAQERARKEAASKPLSTLFSPLQVEAFSIARDLRSFLASQPPFPVESPQRAEESTEDYLVRFHKTKVEDQSRWRNKLMHGYATAKFGQRITALMHRAGAEVEYPAYVPNYAEKPPMTPDDIQKLAQEMEMVAIWISRREQNEVNLLGETRAQ